MRNHAWKKFLTRNHLRLHTVSRTCSNSCRSRPLTTAFLKKKPLNA